MAMILLMIMSSKTATMAEIDISHHRDKRFLFGLFSSENNRCRKKGKRCLGVDSVCCSKRCKHVIMGSDRCE